MLDNPIVPGGPENVYDQVDVLGVQYHLSYIRGGVEEELFLAVVLRGFQTESHYLDPQDYFVGLEHFVILGVVVNVEAAVPDPFVLAGFEIAVLPDQVDVVHELLEPVLVLEQVDVLVLYCIVVDVQGRVNELQNQNVDRPPPSVVLKIF